MSRGVMPCGICIKVDPPASELEINTVPSVTTPEKCPDITAKRMSVAVFGVSGAGVAALALTAAAIAQRAKALTKTCGFAIHNSGHVRHE